LTNDTIRAARSIVGLYNLPTNGKTIEDKITVIIQSKKAETASMLEKQKDIIIALTKGCGTCNFITSDSEVPQGCGSEVVTADVSVHIPVQVSSHIYASVYGVSTTDVLGTGRRCCRDLQVGEEAGFGRGQQGQASQDDPAAWIRKDSKGRSQAAEPGEGKSFRDRAIADWADFLDGEV
jgi:hypothetical protein